MSKNILNKINNLLAFGAKPVPKYWLIIFWLAMIMGVTLISLFILNLNREIENCIQCLLVDLPPIYKEPSPLDCPYCGNEPFVTHHLFLDVSFILPVEEAGLSLPEDLVISPGKYNFAGKIYDLEEAGLYRFIDVSNNRNEQRIVYKNNLNSFLSAIAWIVSHGNLDDDKSVAELTQKATKSKLFLTCGGITSWVSSLLNEVDIQSRQVSSLTLQEWNNYNNGHTMIEIFRPDYQKWILYDLDSNAYFLREGTPLSLVEFIDCLDEDSYKIRYLAVDTKVAISHYLDKYNYYDYGFFSESIFLTENLLRQWYRCVIQVPIIDNYFYTDENNCSRVKSYYGEPSSLVCLNKEEFIKKFYP